VKKIKLFLFMLFIMLPISVRADHMYKIDMKVNISEDGTANVTEVWDVKATSGSEWYKTMYELGNSKLSNFTVLMDGEKLQYKNWDVNESIREKAGYYGINYASKGMELCFGKGDMKRHTFTLNYDLSNYVFNTSDSQILYWTLFPEVTVDNFTVEVSSYYQFPDTLDVWGYGYKGYAYVENGKIKMSNDGGLSSDYVALLVKFPLDTFNTSNIVSGYNSFNDVYNMAEEDTFDYDYDDYYEEGSSSFGIFDFIMIIVPFLFPILIVIVAIVAAVKSGYGYVGNKKIDKKNVNMFRDIPCNKDIYYANVLIKLNNFGYKDTNILGAIILKWVKENKIGFKNETTGIFNRETSVIDLTRNPVFDNDLERKLFEMMHKASEDGMLEAREFERWCKKNYSKFLNLFGDIEGDEIDKLESQGHIYKRTSKEECKKKNVMDDVIYEDSVKLYGLKKYLDEFSSMNTKEVMEVHLWDEYLMFAYLFGIADKVAKQLKNMYPEVLEQANFDYDAIVFVNTISTRGVSAASSARAAAESYSSGGGGFSSGGGGGGSFGGGGGSMGGR